MLRPENCTAWLNLSKPVAHYQVHMKLGLRYEANRRLIRQRELPAESSRKHEEVEIECTPEEARTFFGLPNLQQMQEAVAKEMQERLVAAVRTRTRRKC